MRSFGCCGIQIFYPTAVKHTISEFLHENTQEFLVSATMGFQFAETDPETACVSSWEAIE